MNQDPTTGHLRSTPLERGANPGLPTDIALSEALDVMGNVLAARDLLHHQVQQAHMSHLTSERGRVPHLARNVHILGRTAAELFDYAIINWPITTKSPNN